MRTHTTTVGLLAILTVMSVLAPTATAVDVIGRLNPSDDVCAVDHEWDDNGTISCAAVYADGDYVCVYDYDAASTSCEAGSARISALIGEHGSI